MTLGDWVLLTVLGVIVLSALMAALMGFGEPEKDETPFHTFLGGLLVFGYLAAMGWLVYGIFVFFRWLL